MKTEVAKKWDEKAKKYSAMASSKEADAYEYEVNFPSILSLLPDNFENFLDLGCGSGEFTDLITDTHKPKESVGLDVSPTMVQIAKAKYPNIEFDVQDLESRFDDKYINHFNLIICKLVLMFVDDLENVARECYKVLTPDGSLIISVPNPVYWTVYYLQNKYGFKNRPEFEAMREGYFSEVAVTRGIGGDKDLVFGFKHRTFSTYINTFTSAGFKVAKIDEPKLSGEFLKRTEESSDKLEFPMRLNIKFVK